MPTRKIADSPLTKMCRHPEHNPPGMQVFEPGTYEHTCPGCGHKMVFTVAGMTMYGNPMGYMEEFKRVRSQHVTL